MSFLCRKTTTHCRCPTPVGVCTALLRSFYTAFTANRVCPVPCTKPFLLFFREAEDPCAVFALNVLCHLKQLLLFFRDEAPSLHKKMACLPTTKKTRHQRHRCRRNQPKPTTVSSYYLSQRVYPKPQRGNPLVPLTATPATHYRKGGGSTLNRKPTDSLPRREAVCLPLRGLGCGGTPLHPKPQGRLHPALAGSVRAVRLPGKTPSHP